MDVFYHNLYEFQKGLRNLSLCTFKIILKEKVEKRLQKEDVAYVIHYIGQDKFNVYFGSKESVEVIKSFNTIYLNQLTPEQDFMLGIMLGYDRLRQCQRYLQKISYKKTA